MCPEAEILMKKCHGAFVDEVELTEFGRHVRDCEDPQCMDIKASAISEDLI